METPAASFLPDNAGDEDPSPESASYVQEEGEYSGTPSNTAQELTTEDAAPDAKQVKTPHMQKRRRVTRACDECRKKKIKCDGKQPCTHCTVYSYECTYDQPSNRRRNPAPQYVEALESRLHKAEALLRVVLPDLNLDDPQFDVHATEQMLLAFKREKLQQPPQPPAQPPTQLPDTNGSADAQGSDGAGADESLLESMVDKSGSLDLDDQGHWDYHGHTSGIIFLRRLRKQLGVSQPGGSEIPLRTRPALQHFLESPKSTSDSPQEPSLPPTHDLPPRDVARRLCHNALEDGCAIIRFVHEPSFYALLDRVYDTPPEQFTNEENSFLPLLYIVMSVGCLFSDDGAGTLDLSGYESAIGQGFQYFKAGRQLLEITDCRDLLSLQAICFMVIFLQSSAKLSTCYSYVGIALRSSLRLGLHRSVTANFNPVERELRRRIFWVIRKMDVYVSTLLGLPQMLSDDDIDQEYPMSIDGEFITENGILPTPEGRIHAMVGANAHTRLSVIVLKIVKYIYPLKTAQHRSESDQRYVVSHSKIREIERDLQNWMEELPAALRPGTEVSPQIERIRQLLRISYAHAQMVMYRPFLHYVSSGSQARGVDRRSYACAAACVSVSRNIVHITTGMHKKGLLNGSFWFTMYTTYFAILSLLFFVLENPDSPTAKDGVLKDAMEGKNTLAGLAKKSLAADRCSQSLNCLFKNLPELLKNRQSSKTQVNLKRPAPSNQPAPEPQPGSLQRASTFPVQLLSRPSKQDGNRSPKSLDDNHPPRSPAKPRANRRSWVQPSETPTSAVSTPPEHTPPSSAQMMPRTLPIREAPTAQFTQPMPNTTGFPDLMPIMFPSDDPFAYPTQPMSTLENDHFQFDGNATTAPFMSSIPTTVDQNTLNGFGGLPMFQNATQSSIGAALSGRLSGSHMQSPVSHVSTPGEAVNSPDLVSIPNQNFIWQGYGIDQNQNYVPDATMQQMPTGIEQPFGMADDSAFNAGLDLPGVPLDDIFGNTDMKNGFANDDWTQWMNIG
ncbi:putative C6 transcription factor (Mut3) [Aspergillus mulundensis]|uniref:Putative Zn(II)2Cys6 transcription factor n=1 Tax=Aspergillus mulundensis TaxID=1810919 RepID=A0A3D8SJL0_9EURO|nr:putative Zn(II)2Cys6 transcription factor [Aspergillus mulundensis]RDW86517.1 putative Zn(II)2Cys6 transcription factor [Aspergillus mulundensis]